MRTITNDYRDAQVLNLAADYYLRKREGALADAVSTSGEAVNLAGKQLEQGQIDMFTILRSALYFAVVTYSTVGYGDLVLAKGRRLVAGVEALTGILMCGWSTGFFFIVASKLYGSRLGPRQN